MATLGLGARSLRLAGRESLMAMTRLPGILQAGEWLYRTRFRAGRHHCGYHGVYRSFDEATRALPPGMAGFDHDEMAALDHYTTAAGEIEPMPATEYPVLFWLKQALDGGARSLLDLGGYVGHVFRQYDAYLHFPPEFRWTVLDLPHITQAGERLAARHGSPCLRFANAVDPAAEIDVLFAAGSLQYLPENHLRDLLARQARLPRHVVVQRTPLHAERAFVTIQSIVTRSGRACFCPYTIANRADFIGGLAGLGYELVDAWEKQRSLDVPFHPGYRVETYSGLYLRLREAL